MCFHNGIDVNRAEHIKLKKKSKKIKDLQLNLDQPYASGFDYPFWPVLKPIDGGNDFVPVMMHWEFIPSYIRSVEALLHFRKGGLNPKTGRKDIPHNTLNAIGEEVLNKPTYKDSALKRRCLVLSSGFYEWRHFTPPGGKDTAYPYYLSVKGQEYFFMAGIYNPWVDQESGEVVDSFSILTTAANPLMEKIHNKKKRMPVILPEDQAELWIKDDLSIDQITALARFQLPAEQMEFHNIRKDFRQLEEPREAFLYDELPPIE
jgi:putative SOS response-associated peptidase YedK